MTPYILFMLIMALFLLRYDSVGPRIKKSMTVTTFLILFLFAGLRGSVGSDTAEYIGYFQRAETDIGALSLFLTLEPGFSIFTILLNRILAENWLFISTCSLTQASLLYYIYRNSENKKFIFVYAIIFYLNFHFNTLRAGFAALLLLCALAAPTKIWRISFLLLAPTFHISVLLFYPFLFAYRLKYFIKHLPIIFIAAIILIPTFGYIAGDKVEGYSDYLQDGDGVSLIYSFVMGLFFIICAVSAKGLSKKASIFALMTAVFYLSLLAAPIFYRYVIIGQILYFYALMESQPEGLMQKRFFYLFWPVFLIITTLTYAAIINEGENLNSRFDISANSAAIEYTMIPYQFFWNDPLID